MGLQTKIDKEVNICVFKIRLVIQGVKKVYDIYNIMKSFLYLQCLLYTRYDYHNSLL